MTERIDSPAPTKPARAEHAPTKPGPTKIAPQPAADELEQERLEPGLRTGGTGGVGAAPGKRKGHDNSNT